jgi:hypothetical protein
VCAERNVIQFVSSKTPPTWFFLLSLFARPSCSLRNSLAAAFLAYYPSRPFSCSLKSSSCAIDAIRGKAKESCIVSGTTVDNGNAAQRELRPDERSLQLNLDQMTDLGQYVSVSPVTLLPTFRFFLFYYIGEESWQFLNNM